MPRMEEEVATSEDVLTDLLDKLSDMVSEADKKRLDISLHNLLPAEAHALVLATCRVAIVRALIVWLV